MGHRVSHFRSHVQKKKTVCIIRRWPFSIALKLFLKNSNPLWSYGHFSKLSPSKPPPTYIWGILEEKLIGANEFGGISSLGNFNLENVRENALVDRSSTGGPDREAAHCVVEAREGTNKEWGAIWVTIRRTSHVISQCSLFQPCHSSGGELFLIAAEGMEVSRRFVGWRIEVCWVEVNWIEVCRVVGYKVEDWRVATSERDREAQRWRVENSLPQSGIVR